MQQEIQAILFPVGNFNTDTARKWLNKSGYTPIKRVHKTAEYLRYRIAEPDKTASYTSKKLNNGIILVLKSTTRPRWADGRT